MTHHLEQLNRDAELRGSVVISQPSRHWKVRVLLPGTVLGIMVLLVGVTLRETLTPTKPVNVVPVIVKTITGGDDSKGSSTIVQAPGWLEPDPHPYFIAALAEGVVDRVLVLEGEEVEAGQVVVELIDDDAQLALARAEAQLAQQRAEARVAAAELEAANLDLKYLIEQTLAVAVAEGRIAEIEAEILVVEAEVAAADAAYLEVQDEYNRKSGLTESRAVAEATVARLLLEVDAKRALVQAAKAKYAVLDAQLVQARSILHAANTTRELLIEERRAVAIAEAKADHAVASVRLAEVTRDEAQLYLDRMQVRAPISGTIMRRFVSPGAEVANGPNAAHVLSMYDPTRMQMRVDIPLADAALISLDQEAEIVVEVLPDRVFHGRVTRMVHEADIQKNTVEIKVSILDPAPDLKPEMLARARLFGGGGATPSSSSRHRIFAPDAALLRREGDVRVAQVVRGLSDGRGRVEERNITVGAQRMGGWIEVRSGLQPGDLLVVDRDESVSAGDYVRVMGEDPDVKEGNR